MLSPEESKRDRKDGARLEGQGFDSHFLQVAFLHEISNEITNIITDFFMLTLVCEIIFVSTSVGSYKNVREES